MVNVSVTLLAINDVDEDQQSFSADLLLRTGWMDKRLGNLVERETVFVESLPSVWTPHLTILNAESGHTGKSLALREDGTLDLTERLI